VRAESVSSRPGQGAQNNGSGAVVEVDSLCKFYRTRDGKQALFENLLRRLLGIQPRSQELCALRNITFRVARGESLGIVGANGAGKSTLLKILAGIATPTSGTVNVHARIATQLALGSGFHPYLSGRENIFLQGSILGMTNRQILARLPMIIEFAGIGDAINRPLWTYSSGMMSRLGFSVAAHVDFDLLLLDEALSAGDLGFRDRCTQTLRKFRASGATMVIVSHGSENLRQLCDRVMWIEGGEIRAIGPAAEIVEQYEAPVARRSDAAETRGAQRL
jgi:lipopolysaccharide transport system ATP-binding protein